jgi:hypothetical protein
VGAGGVSSGLIGRLPRNAIALGPVGGVSYRVASRIANKLKAGWPVRSLDEMDSVRLILFHAPPEYLPALGESLTEARIQWAGKSLIFCDCESVPVSILTRFRELGASVATVRRSVLPGRLILQGPAPALTFASRLARELKLRPVVISEGSETLFDAAMTLGSGGLTPIIDGVARTLRQCGLRDTEAAQLAAALFSRTAAEYAHSGKQSWQWHIETPNADQLLAQIGVLDEPLKSLLSHLLVAGFSLVERHESVSQAIRDAVGLGKNCVGS